MPYCQQQLDIDGIAQLKQVLHLTDSSGDDLAVAGRTGSPKKYRCRHGCEQSKALRARFQQVLLQQQQTHEKAQATLLAAHKQALQRQVSIRAGTRQSAAKLRPAFVNGDVCWSCCCLLDVFDASTWCKLRRTQDRLEPAGLLSAGTLPDPTKPGTLSRLTEVVPDRQQIIKQCSGSWWRQACCSIIHRKRPQRKVHQGSRHRLPGPTAQICLLMRT